MAKESTEAPIGYPEVIAQELDHLVGPAPPELQEAARQAKCCSLSALCLSGGGIRSATFNLGILEGLAAIGLLDKFDYLSTVSGGGYIGSWLSSWARRAQGPAASRECAALGTGISQVARTLDDSFPGGQEIPQVRFLRDYSNYLSPRLGILSGDTWTLGGIYLRNLLINWLMLVPFFFALLGIPRIYIKMLPERLDQLTDLCLWGGFTLGVLGVFCSCADLPTFAVQVEKVRAFCRRSFLPCCWLSAFLFSLYWAAASPRHFESRDILPLFLGGGIGIFGLGWLLRAPFYLFQEMKTADRCSKKTAIWRFALSTLAALLAGAFGGGICFYLGTKMLPLIPDPGAGHQVPVLYATVAVPILMAVYLLAGVIHILLLNTWTGDEDREWWARSGAYLMMGILGWLALFSLVIFGPWLCNVHNVRNLLAALGTTGFSGLVTALFGKSRGTPSALRGTEQKENPFAKFGLHFAALLFIVLLVIVLSSLASIITTPPPGRVPSLVTNCGQLSPSPSAKPAPSTVRPLPADGATGPAATSDPPTDQRPATTQGTAFANGQASAKGPAAGPAKAVVVNDRHLASFCGTWTLRDLCGLFLGSLAFSLLVGWLTNPNRFSLHALYRSRLIRAYLGATRDLRTDPRNPHPFTGFDPDDNLSMENLPSRPLQILNIAWNVVTGESLRWQERKAVSFTVSKLHCGNADQGYRPSDHYGTTCGVGPISLGTAMAVSGAAASPNMGYHSSPLVTFVMAFFNLRLGWWLGNPKKDKWRKSGPSIAFWPLLKETFGFTGTDSTFIYLSDGGHFENLGLYEMVRRRCRFIVVGDASCDASRGFEDFGNAVRKIRVDLGAEIDIDLEGLKPKPDEKDGLKKSASHFAIGKISYAADQAATATGTLLYIKPTLCKEIPVDVFDYAYQHRDFPHEPTTDQWFSESQFESYRELGLHTVQHLVGSEVRFEGVAEFLASLEEKPTG
ncbi:patatin-like phospholipase family protein [Geomonas sp.]|uniref:patatin-like phospholipase family protein n=1 Tax=Geomonas sp. TaxID=2651584 RepID=UPI002B48D6C5|nr:patatin-like phospholipase family protein [Geomonas sp.]HJV34739.1 patatin-like phospholipase family protein [Geomonas sp.]